MDTLVTTIGLVIVAAIGAYSAWLQRSTGAVVKDTHRQVVTLNESTIGELAAADETRRAETIPYERRTRQEQRHLDESPVPAAPQGPRLADRLAHVEQVGVETHDRVEQVHHAVNGDAVEPKPSLYELMVDLHERFDQQAARLDNLEAQIGLPPSDGK